MKFKHKKFLATGALAIASGLGISTTQAAPVIPNMEIIKEAISSPNEKVVQQTVQNQPDSKNSNYALLISMIAPVLLLGVGLVAVSKEEKPSSNSKNSLGNLKDFISNLRSKALDSEHSIESKRII
jgi:uncharacterized protein HemX